MKKYTQEEFDALPSEKGRKICPTGDYSEITKFGDDCSFGERCSFGELCSFGRWCSFGECCSFGKCCKFGVDNSFGKGCSFGGWCSFDKCCSFGEWCSFGERGYFGKGCEFGDDCSFGERCSFGELCSFGRWCSFGECCRFGKCCEFENKGPAKPGYPFVAWVGAGSRPGSKTYFFNLQDGIYVRCGCFLGTLDEFRDRVRAVHSDDGLAAEYLAVAEIVEKKFSN